MAVQRIKINEFPHLDNIEGSELLPLGRATDGNGVQVTMQEFKDWIGFEQFTGVLPQKATSTTLVGAAGVPAIYIGNAGTYTLNGGAATEYTEPVNYFFWNGTEWNVLEVPIETKIETWTAGTYAEGDQRIHNGQIWSVDVVSTTEEPGTGTDWVAKTDKGSRETKVFNEVIEPTIIQGTVSSSTGNISASTSRLYTDLIVLDGAPISVETLGEFQFYPVYYDEEGVVIPTSPDIKRVYGVFNETTRAYQVRFVIYRITTSGNLLPTTPLGLTITLIRKALNYTDLNNIYDLGFRLESERNIGVDELEQGTISASTGAPTSSTIVIRSKFFIPVFGRPFSLSVSDEYQLETNEYSEDLTFIPSSRLNYEYSQEKTNLNINLAAYTRIVVTRKDGGSITPVDVGLRIEFYKQGSKAIDDAVISAFQAVGVSEIKNPLFFQGDISSANGRTTTTNLTKSIHTDFLITNYKIGEVAVNTGYKVGLRYYTRYLKFIGVRPGADISGSGEGGSPASFYTRFTISKIDGSDIQPSEDVGLTFTPVEKSFFISKGSTERTYSLTDWGITPENSKEDNTEKLQKLNYMVGERPNGGVIYIPDGEFIFDNSEGRVLPFLSNVSFRGQSSAGAILKIESNDLSPFFYDIQTNVIKRNAVHSDFTIDLYGIESNSYYVGGKQYWVQAIEDCIFENLRLLGSPATSLGIDFLNRTTIRNVYVKEGGRLNYLVGQRGPGGAGIGIGTGLWEEENFTITDCLTELCSNFGIFIEYQSNPLESKGHVIANNISRDNIYSGFGARGGSRALFSNNASYNNGLHGFELEGSVKYSRVDGNISTGNGGDGIHVVSSLEMSNTSITNNLTTENTGSGIFLSGSMKRLDVHGNNSTKNGVAGISILGSSEKMAVRDNYTAENPIGINLTGAKTDFVFKGNTPLDGVTNSASFLGNTEFNDLI